MSGIEEDYREITISVIPVHQPIGLFYIGVMAAERLCEITDFDVRRMIKERDFESYLGIQREVDPKRVKQIQQYVETKDACFPAGVILSVSANCASLDTAAGRLTLHNHLAPEDPDERIRYRAIAKVIDGQHRIEGLKQTKNKGFQVAVSIFIGIDVAEEGYIFSTVNLAQTKVNRSLATDLYDLAVRNSPQKLCHNVAVTLDQEVGSPFFRRIKRLGVATEGRFDETITQATVYDMLMPYISKNPVQDRDLFLRGHVPEKAPSLEMRKLLFRNMFLEGRELEIVDVLWNYFEAVQKRWPTAWNSTQKGDVLSKTNGFRALMRFLRPVYLAVVQKIGDVPSTADFKRIFDRMALEDRDFNTSNYVPGTSGESNLLRAFAAASGLKI